MMRVLFVFLTSIVLLVISGCAASKDRLRSESNLTEARSSQRESSDNSGQQDNTKEAEYLIVFYSTASTQPQGAAGRVNGYGDRRNNRPKEGNLSGHAEQQAASNFPVPTGSLAYDRDTDTLTYSEGHKVIRLSSNELASLLLNLTPFIGDAKGFIEAVIGLDLLTGDPLSPVDRFLGLLCSSELRGIKKGVELTQAAVDAQKAVSKINRKRKIRNRR